MTKKDFEKLGMRLVPDLPGFAAKGQLLFMRPVGHTLRGVCFDGSSFEPHLFFVHVFLQPLFVPAEHVGLNLGWRIGGGSRRWDARAEGLLAELGAALQREAVPFLSRVESPRDLADVLASLQKSNDPYVQQAIAYSLARAGETNQAVVQLDQLVRLLTVNESYPWQREMAQRAETLKSTLVARPAEARQQFEAWEHDTARNLGLETFL